MMMLVTPSLFFHMIPFPSTLGVFGVRFGAEVPLDLRLTIFTDKV